MGTHWKAYCAVSMLGLATTSLALEASAAAEETGVATSIDCAYRREIGTWFRSSGGSPYRIDIRYPADRCALQADVWEKQSDGSLWHRGTFAVEHLVLDDGSAWVSVAPVSVGGYVAHYWVQAIESADRPSARVWTYYESLDSKPDATEDVTYRNSPPIIFGDFSSEALELKLSSDSKS